MNSSGITDKINPSAERGTGSVGTLIILRRFTYGADHGAQGGIYES